MAALLDAAWHAEEAARSLQRLLPRLRQRAGSHLESGDWATFESRLEQHFPRLFQLLLHLYGRNYDFFYHLQRVLESAADAWLARPADLKQLDRQRELDPLWFESERNMGAVCYVDRFAGSLGGLRQHLDYLGELGLSYLHLMPLFRSPAGNNDGGYAVSSYRELDPRLGSMDDLAQLARELRARGISLVLDFVINHTADDHAWARGALAGDPDYQAYYWMFPDRELPDAYERHVREIFPDEHPGSFTYRPEVGKWVWTTFHTFQWDLNYRNPTVFRRMAEEMLFLANQGVEILRLDAVAFLWKELGTSCEGRPEAHLVVQAWNALARIAAPALLFKSEAIVHPDEVITYIGRHEAQLSYNPLLMALLWESLATREVRLLQHSMRRRFGIPDGCTWVNYVRSHDDIGWTFSDEDAAELGIRAYDHRQFLNAFYFGRFPGSFARGLPFQEDPRTGDARVSGTLASLAGLEKALAEEGAAEVELAVGRMLLMHAVILSIGGLPLLYLGDEIGMLNDYTYRQRPAEASDSRWVHRPSFDWLRAANRYDPRTVQGRVFVGLQRLIRLRAACPALAGGSMRILDCDNRHVLAYARSDVLVLANFSEAAQTVHLLDDQLGPAVRDLVRDEVIPSGSGLRLEPYQFVWLTPSPAG